MECFAQGANVYPHKPEHDYRVVNNVKTPLWTEDWGADEELMLLEAIEMYGMGNCKENTPTHRKVDTCMHGGSNLTRRSFIPLFVVFESLQGAMSVQYPKPN